jgi:hypothetical protein
VRAPDESREQRGAGAEARGSACSGSWRRAVGAAPGAPCLIEQRLQAPEHCRGDRNRRQGRDARLQEALEFGRLRLRHDDAAWGDAGRAAVQPQPEGVSATMERSASGTTKTGSLPDSSSAAGVSRGARSASTARPVPAEPVRRPARRLPRARGVMLEFLAYAALALAALPTVLTAVNRTGFWAPPPCREVRGRGSRC